MKAILAIATLAVVTLASSNAFAQTAPAAPVPAQKAPMSDATPCKGLDQPSCEALSHCRWFTERIAGQTKTRAGNLSKTSAKAHCRTGQRAKGPAKQ